MIYPRAIIPTVLIPFTLLTVLLSSIASFIAALFGLHLSTEGPRRLLEALLKPRVLLAALLLNGAVYGGVRAWKFWRTLPRLEIRVERENRASATASARTYPDTDGAPPAVTAPSAKTVFDPGPPQVAWSAKLPAGSFAGGVRSGPSLFFGTEDGRIEEIEVADGGKIRSFYVGTSIPSTPLVFGGFLYSGEGSHETHHARVYKFDLRTGGFAGAYATAGHTEGRLVAASWRGRDYLFAPAGADGLHAIDPATMKRIWRRQDGHSDASVAFADGTVFWGTGRERSREENARMWAVAADARDGALKWKRELPASSWMQPAIVGADVCFPVGEIYFHSGIGGVLCFDRASGAPTASFMRGEGVIAAPILLDGDLVVTEINGRICRLSYESRRVRWCTDTDGGANSLANVTIDRARGWVLYPSRKGGLFVLDPADGRVLSKWPAGPASWASTYAPVELADGSWVVADMEGTVRALRVDYKVSSGKN